MIYVADFETTLDKKDCRVWGWGMTEVCEEPEKMEYGNNIESFMENIFLKGSHIYYFHNAKFDADFIFNYLFRHNFYWVEDKKGIKPNEFTTLIGDDGIFYSCTICVKVGNKKNKIEIRDSMNLINFSVKKISENFKFKTKKLEIDYEKKRPIWHILTEEEKEYIKHDVWIVAKALYYFINNGWDKITIGSCAYHEYIDLKGGRKNFRKIFPELDVKVDKDLRAAYRGGVVQVKKGIEGKEIGEGVVVDNNSLYPWCMHSPNMLPYGRPVFFEGKYEDDEIHPLYIQRIKCQFEIKKDKLPCIQIRNNIGFVPTEYLESSNGEQIILTVTNIDLGLIKEQYDLYDIEYISGWKFKACSGLFDDYIDKYMTMKIKGDKENNKVKRTIGKLYQNALVGRFAIKCFVRNNIPYLGKDMAIHYKVSEIKEREGGYIPVSIFTNSLGRDKFIRSAQKVYHRFLSGDTDSLHLSGWELPEELEIDKYKLGAWKVESYFDRAKYLRPKCYMEMLGDNKKITVAGLPEICYEQVTFENFMEGAIYTGKLTPERVPNGTVLVRTTFEIKKRIEKILFDKENKI